jgi:hypothetical protein
MFPAVLRLKEVPDGRATLSLIKLIVPEVLLDKNTLPAPDTEDGAEVNRFTSPDAPLDIAIELVGPVAPMFPLVAVSVMELAERLPPELCRMLV